ncbi:MAG TPA: Holliday junction resolvase RuvX [Fimbriimonas sp.]
MRVLGIDFGFKRIGVAVGETGAGVASARPPLEAAGALKRDAERISLLARREEADAIVVGLPLEKGVEGRMARICRTLGEHLASLGERVEFVDESLSSVEAEATLRGDDLKASQRRKLRDGEAARLILERYMHEEASR